MDLAISATTGAAPVPVPPPNARGDEQKVDAFKSLLDLLAGLLGSHLADLGIGPRSETARPVRADLYLAFFGNERHVERLHIRVHDEETRALMPARIMLLTALLPPPPTPRTTMFALPGILRGTLPASGAYSEVAEE